MQGLSTKWKGASWPGALHHVLSRRTCGHTGSVFKCQGRKNAASPVGASPPPWATHGPEVMERLPPRKLAAKPHSVQFRGTESLASMHLIDQEQAANARLSQKLNAGILADQVRRLPAVSEDHLSLASGGHERAMQRSSSWSR
eukprot:g8215.t1